MPSMGAKSATVMTWPSSTIPAYAVPTLTSAVAMGSSDGGERAEGEEQHDGRDGHADDLGEVPAGRLGERDGAAAQLDLEPVGRGGLRGVDDGLRLARRRCPRPARRR